MGEGQLAVGKTAETANPRTRRSRLASPTTAVALFALQLVLAIVAVLLGAATHQLALSSSSSYALGLSFAVVGLVVAVRQPGNPMGWVLLGAAGFLVLSGDASSYSVLDYRMHHGTMPLGPVAVFLQPTWAPAVVLIGLTVLLFPDGQLPSRRWRWVLWAVLAAGALFQLGAFAIVLSAIIGHNIHVTSGGDLRVIDYPTGGYVWWVYVEAVFFVVVGASWLAWLVRQVPNYLKSTGELRLQQKWFLSGATIFAISAALSVRLSNSKGFWGHFSQVAGVGFVALPIAIGIGILKFRLYDIDRLISRTLAYALVTGLVIGVYVGIVTLTNKALGVASPVAVAASTFAAAAVFSPLRRRVQRIVDRRFNRVHYDAEATVASFRARLRDAVDLETVRSELLDVVNRAVEPAHAWVWIRQKQPG